MPRIAWWQSGIVYQVYPRSFQDSNGDGVGDLIGIRNRLDHLKWLGVDALWISPFFPSPMADFGYDVQDYCGVDPLFGTLDDFDALVAKAHGKGLKVILDFVPNHTSDQHPWLVESRSSRHNPKRDWYIWRDPKPDGSPPNNWVSHFGGSAWQLDEATGQYYYHAFLKEQPDLDWRNPEVQSAMHDTLRFWMNRGVDGFRVDVIWLMIKDRELRDNPINPAWHEGMPDIQRVLPVHTADQPEVHEVIRGLRRVVDEYDDRVLIGEIYLPVDRLVTYYGEDLTGTHLPFNFQLILAQWKADVVASLITEYEAALPPGGWPNWVLGNHDQPRIAARVGAAQARVAAMLLLTLRGTPTIYYGDELGLSSVAIPPEAAQDPWEKNEPGRGFSRDPERTPMQWDETENAGFTTGRPWLPLSDDHTAQNVDRMREDETSILWLYRRLVALRREKASFSIGDFRLLTQSGDVLVFQRLYRDERFIVALNMSSRAATVAIPEMENGGAIRLSTSLSREAEHVSATLVLDADEGLVIEPA
ncbi:alpha-amylase family glycosyl hydrolase [Consotaella salsifontis]|uniref:Alpha-glucosidase n=1 Tax=Consotaella salsifontis TaxID=1365950 RepID=A0A1T4RDB1_9HYPH|nr:alpha-amylase family glycosyl hydrolase [Consotaella salsifontis]SKA13945.1 alpha-glucosidase [Consotaella salsifontis]